MVDLWTVAIIVGLTGLALLAYSVGALDRKGALISFVMGIIVALSAGVTWLVLMVCFTVVGVLATRFGYARKQANSVAEKHGGERRAGNVLANGAAATLAAVTVQFDVVPPEASALAFATAVAAVTADTLASEVGGLQTRARRILPPFGLAEPGENGAVSWLGQSAAAAGALLIGALAVPLLGLAWPLMWIPALWGFLGCQLDSILGATLEGDHRRSGPLGKGDVNFLASAVPALIVLVIASL